MSRYLDGLEQGAKVKFEDLQEENRILRVKLERAILDIKKMVNGSDAACLIYGRELLDYLEEEDEC